MRSSFLAQSAQAVANIPQHSVTAVSATAINGFNVAFLEDVTAAQELPRRTTTHSALYSKAALPELLVGFFHYYVHVFDQKSSVVSIHREGRAELDKVRA
jgi:Cid1 family poly A polymerase